MKMGFAAVAGWQWNPKAIRVDDIGLLSVVEVGVFRHVVSPPRHPHGFFAPFLGTRRIGQVIHVHQRT